MITNMVNTTSTAKDQQSQETWRRGGNVTPLFFQLAGLEDQQFWGEEYGPTMVV